MNKIRWFKVVEISEIIENNKYIIKEHEILGKNKYRDCKISREKSLFRCCVVRAYAKTFYSAAKCWEQSRAEQRPRFLALVVH